MVSVCGSLQVTQFPVNWVITYGSKWQGWIEPRDIWYADTQQSVRFCEWMQLLANLSHVIDPSTIFEEPTELSISNHLKN